MNNTLNKYLETVTKASKKIPQHRQVVLKKLIDYVVKKKGNCGLIYVCTHNSRRSQFSQVWSFIVSRSLGLNNIRSFSAGTEETAFNERAIESLLRAGVKIEKAGIGPNFQYKINAADDLKSLLTFSKVIDDSINPINNFASVMTCSHADDNCPIIVGGDDRIPVRYVDPKAHDDTDKEEEAYDERSFQIASELTYVFTEAKKILN